MNRHGNSKRKLSSYPTVAARRLRGLAIPASLAVAVSLAIGTPVAQADPMHGIAILGEPALAAGFTHLPYANPDAPQGGRIVYGEIGGFDSLNPHIVKGRAPWGMRAHVFESLMVRSRDEPFTMYGLLAETVETPEDRSWVEFRLREEARFSDGSPVNVEDVVFSMTTLRDEGRPNHRRYYSRVTETKLVGDRGVRFMFDKPDQELPLLMCLMPILKKADWEGKEFAETTLTAPVATGPYLVESVDPGRSIVFRRNPNYWGRDLPVNRGRNNFDEIRYEYFRDDSARFEAFKAGEIRLYQESDPVQWEEGYGFPAALDGRVKRGEVSHQRPTGMHGMVMNTRRPQFSDIRVRQALERVFDFEWINDTLYRSAYVRIPSYFGNSELGHRGVAAGRERELLLPFADELPEGAMAGEWRPTAGDGTERGRRQRLRQARVLLEAAGWKIEDGVLRDHSGEEFSFEMLVRSQPDQRIGEIFAKTLEPLGIRATTRLVDSAQYQTRLTEYDFDMIVNRWWLSLSPGAEQAFYWGSEGVETPGTRNYMGVASSALDSLVESLTAARNREDFVAAARAIDRTLSFGVYVIPFWTAPKDRFAWWSDLHRPGRDSLYGYQPEVWWSE